MCWSGPECGGESCTVQRTESAKMVEMVEMVEMVRCEIATDRTLSRAIIAHLFYFVKGNL
jgi:hypothetical protein